MDEVKNLNDMSLKEFLLFYKRLSDEERMDFIKSDKLLNLPNNLFKTVVLNSLEEENSIILKNEILYNKLMELTNDKRSILTLLENKIPVLKLIIESPYSSKYFDKFQLYIKNISIEKINQLSEVINFEFVFGSLKDKNNIKTYLENIFKYDFDGFEELLETFVTKIKNNQINPILIFKLEDYMQFVLLCKFCIIVNAKDSYGDTVLESNSTFPYEKILSIKDKHIVKLIEMLKEKGKCDEYIYLEVALKLYFIFGFDNSKKIIEDKFTYLNESSLIRIVDFNFKDLRREFRMKNQDKFYFYGMEEQIKESLSKDDDKIFSSLLFEPTIENIGLLRKEFLSIMYQYDSTPELSGKIKEKLCECITERENSHKSKLYDEIKKRVDNKINETTKLDAKKLFSILKDVDIGYLLEQYNFGVKNDLNAFLLGNTKSNNDCLLRLILNGEALGLNKNLSILINNFDLLKTVTEENNLSINSVLDVIDILKMDLYDLKPNEQDITLETLTRVINSTEYKVDYDLDYAKEICKLHVERKKKTYSSIPSVSGNVGKYKYYVAPFDAEYLLAAGNDGKSCLRIGAIGQNFFEYCLKSPNAVIIYIEDDNGKKYVCPTIRSGNAINCNGIDPLIEEDKIKDVLSTLSVCFKDIINESYKIDRPHSSNIEIATVSSLHLIDYFDSINIEEYKIKQPLPLDCACYCDYNKNTLKHFVLAKSKTYKKEEYYLSDDKFYQKRSQNYEFDVTREYDKERLSLIVNSIYYSSIDYQDISNIEKDKRKREFKELNVENFKYITGNKDWFVAIDGNYNVLSFLLPYDDRAIEDYFESLKKAPSILQKLIGETYVRKNI